MHPFRRLKVWRKAHELALRSCRATAGLPNAAYPGLAAQIRRAAVSIPANIAEGAGRDTPRQFAHHLEIAIRSARELDYLLLLSRDLGPISPMEHARLAARAELVCAMLVALRKRVCGQGGSRLEGD